jgi:rod shape-determining protein MreC
LRGKRPFYFLAFAFLPLLLVLQAPQRTEFIHQISLTCLRPLLQVSHTVSLAFQKTAERLVQFWDLYQNQGMPLARVEGLERERVEMEELKKENERLRELLAFKKEIPVKTIPARVIGRDLAPWRRTILLDKGSKQGIQKRMAVVNAQGLVGRVVEVAPFSARVILLQDPESRVSVLFQESRDLGVAEGDGSSFLRVTHIDRQASVKVGDRVISSGLGQVYPKGIPVGEVKMVGTEKEGLELFASVSPSVNFSKLEEVLCVISSLADS